MEKTVAWVNAIRDVIEEKKSEVSFFFERKRKAHMYDVDCKERRGNRCFGFFSISFCASNEARLVTKRKERFFLCSQQHVWHPFRFFLCFFWISLILLGCWRGMWMSPLQRYVNPVVTKHLIFSGQGEEVWFHSKRECQLVGCSGNLLQFVSYDYYYSYSKFWISHWPPFSAHYSEDVPWSSDPSWDLSSRSLQMTSKKPRNGLKRWNLQQPSKHW